LEKSDSHRAYVAELMASLKDDTMPLLDFDRLATWLGEIGPLLAASESSGSELALLREDYVARISGMVKAIAVADRKNNRYETALALIESFSGMAGSELVECYRRTCSRFRDCFPASFVRQLELHPRIGRAKEYSDYK
jgi:hypothetical protein